MEYPKSVVPTEYGPLVLTATQKDHIHIVTEDHRHGPYSPLGFPIYASAHAYTGRSPEGWTIPTDYQLSISRYDRPFNKNHVTDRQQAKIVAILLAVVTAWATPEIVAAAHVARCNNEIRTLEMGLADLDRRRAVIMGEMDAWVARMGE